MLWWHMTAHDASEINAILERWATIDGNTPVGYLQWSPPWPLVAHAVHFSDPVIVTEVRHVHKVIATGSIRSEGLQQFVAPRRRICLRLDLRPLLVPGEVLTVLLDKPVLVRARLESSDAAEIERLLSKPPRVIPELADALRTSALGETPAAAPGATGSPGVSCGPGPIAPGLAREHPVDRSDRLYGGSGVCCLCGEPFCYEGYVILKRIRWCPRCDGLFGGILGVEAEIGRRQDLAASAAPRLPPQELPQ